MCKPTSGTDWSQQWRAQAAKRYMAGARGHPCRTPASHMQGDDMNPFTTAAARVLLKRVQAHPTIPADLAFWPSPAVPSHWGCPTCPRTGPPW
eukprot:1136647-Pelagomonas_calceolata.AAC.4